MSRKPKGYGQRERIRKVAFAGFLAENADLENTSVLQYAFEQGFLAGQLHELDNSREAFRRILEDRS